jgi:hypothetical protein
MAKNKAKKRLAGWDHRLWEMRAFLFSTTEEFDDWCREARSTDVSGKALSRAAKFFHLDLKKPAHQKILLFILADILFGDPDRMGRPKKWQGQTYQLIRDRTQATNGDESISDVKAAEMMKQQFRERYRHDQPETLRKRLSAARREFERREAKDRWIKQLAAASRRRVAKQLASQKQAKPAAPVQ